MRILGAVLLPLGVLLTISPAMHSQGNGTFSQPNSALLFGKFRSSLYIVTPTRTIELKDVSEDGIPVYFPVPSLARTLDRLAWSGEKGDHTEIGVYAVRDQSWKSFADICYAGGGPIAFSPDATKIAFVSAMPPTPMHGVCPTTHQTVLQILDLATGRITNLSCCGWALRGRLGWSPDGKEIVVQHLRQIAIVETDTGKARTIVDGRYPSWSPKGDWIAYFDLPLTKCFIVQPDGTGAKIVRDTGSGFVGRVMIYGAVWSPDGRKLLLNEENDHQHIRVVMVDVATGRTTTKSTNGLAVLGWVPAI